MSVVGPRGGGGLTVGFLLIWYSVVYTVESIFFISFLYLYLLFVGDDTSIR